MTADSKPRRERHTRPDANVRPISSPASAQLDRLPSSPDAEKFVLGAVLLDGSRFGEIATLTPEDFLIERHRSIFARMFDLHNRGEHIDRVTVAEELERHNELGPDGLGYLVSLDDGIPLVPHLRSWIRILRKKTRLRHLISAAQNAAEECFLRNAEPDAITSGLESLIEKVGREEPAGAAPIRRVEDLQSIFANRTPTDYLVQPELPVKALVCLTGDSESGKTTLACAWARDVFSRGHAVLLLDRDKNPRDVICNRLERLCIPTDGERFKVWDCEQGDDVPQPDDQRVIAWVKRMVAETGKPPLVIVDSLISFLREGEDENSAKDMRALFDRCRALTRLGATVIVIHHTNRNGEARGSSDFIPAGDQAFLVSNKDRNGGRLLDLISLRFEKSRYGHSGFIRYHYAGGRMLRIEERDSAEEVGQQLVDLLKANPGILTEPFAELAHKRGFGRNKGREFLKNGANIGTIRVKKDGRKHLHFWDRAEGGLDEADHEGKQGSGPG